MVERALVHQCLDSEEESHAIKDPRVEVSRTTNPGRAEGTRGAGLYVGPCRLLQ